jgi:hypothetical protein
VHADRPASPRRRRQKLAKLGTSAVLSYAFVSNLSHISCLIASWVIHGRKTGLSPLDAGQWPAFLAVYAAFYAFQVTAPSLQPLVEPARDW